MDQAARESIDSAIAFLTAIRDGKLVSGEGDFEVPAFQMKAAFNRVRESVNLAEAQILAAR